MSKVDAYNPDYYASMPVQPIIKYQMRRGRKEDVEDTDKKILRYKKWLNEMSKSGGVTV